MAYLQRNAHKRVDPQKVVADARTIIVLAASYSTETKAEQGEAAGFGGASGVIARYARFEDYHDVMGERLKVLADFLSAKSPNSRSLWYVDTGPFLERDLAQRAGIG